MKINVFKVEKHEQGEDLESVLKQIEAESIFENRIRMINQAELRAEKIDHIDGLWLMDFVRIRASHGPGKVGKNSEIEGFEFKDDEWFGEETAALFDPKSKHILVQYNHYGVRDSAIASYLSRYDRSKANEYVFKPRLDQEIERRLQNQTIMKKIVFTIDVTKMTEADRKAGHALDEAIEFGRSSGGDKIKVEISVQRDNNSGLTKKASECLNSLKNILGQNKEAIPKLEVSGKSDKDSITEVLDLIGHRLSVEFKDIQLGADLRYSREERWNRLIRARNGWVNIFK